MAREDLASGDDEDASVRWHPTPRERPQRWVVVDGRRAAREEYQRSRGTEYDADNLEPHEQRRAHAEDGSAITSETFFENEENSPTTLAEVEAVSGEPRNDNRAGCQVCDPEDAEERHREAWPPRDLLPRAAETRDALSAVRENGSVEEFRIEDFIGLETQVWRALADGDADADGRLLSDDFLGVYPTGFADRTHHVGQLADGPTVAAFTLYDARLIVVSESAVMLSYRAEFEPRASSAPAGVEAMYVSSLWCRRGGKWVNVFSQDTPEA